MNKLFLPIAILFIGLYVGPIYGLSIASREPIQGGQVKDGMIIILEGSTYSLSTQMHDERMTGVTEFNPAVEYVNADDQDNEVPVVKEGIVSLLVTTANGPIAEGDWLTGSLTPGIGQRSNGYGTVIGTALESYDGPENELGEILIEINITNPHGSLVSGLGFWGQEGLNPIINLMGTRSGDAIPFGVRFMIAAIVLLGSIVLGLYTFGRVAQRGVEAIGRNPLAKGTIMLGVTINVILAGFVVLSGLIVAVIVMWF